MTASQFYQLGGFQGHTNGWFRFNEAKLSDAVFHDIVGDQKDRDLELVLGVLPNGASYLLMTPEQTTRVQKACGDYKRLNAPWPATRFASLSPITFTNADQLCKKLKSYNQKPGNKSTLRVRCESDSSQANKAFVMTGQEDLSRSSFEQQRIFWMVLERTLDLRKFCLPELPWINNIMIRALSFHTWDTDSRPREEKESKPKVLDIGWTDVHCTSSIRDALDCLDQSTDIVVKENSMLRYKGSDRVDCKYGPSEVLNKESISTRLAEIFPSHQSGPLVLLVHDKIATLNALRSCGIDGSHWQSGIKALVDHTALREGRSSRYDNKPGRYDEKPARYDEKPGRYDDRRGLSRRSRSPANHGAASRSSALSPTHPQTFIVDIHAMYLTLRKSGDKTSLLSLAADLGVPTDNEAWCAGNESRLLLQVWQSMASGISIDEQRSMRWSSIEPTKTEDIPSSSKATDPGAEDVDLLDDECDPNDVPVTTVVSREAEKHVVPGDDYQLASEDEDYEY